MKTHKKTPPMLISATSCIAIQLAGGLADTGDSSYLPAILTQNQRCAFYQTSIDKEKPVR